MKAGDLRHRVTIQKRALVANSMNELVPTFSDLETVWAAVEPLSGREFFQAKQANSEVAGKVRIRYMDGILPTMRVKFGNRNLLIDSIIAPKENRRELILMYTEDLG